MALPRGQKVQQSQFMPHSQSMTLLPGMQLQSAPELKNVPWNSVTQNAPHERAAAAKRHMNEPQLPSATHERAAAAKRAIAEGDHAASAEFLYQQFLSSCRRVWEFMKQQNTQCAEARVARR